MLKNLNSEQKNILASIRQGMDFAADIAHACITVYLASDDKRFLRVYHQSMPKTQFLQQPELAPGREVRISEEPLIARCLGSLPACACTPCRTGAANALPPWCLI